MASGVPVTESLTTTCKSPLPAQPARLRDGQSLLAWAATDRFRPRSQDEPPDRPSVEPLTPAALADALERGRAPRRPRRAPLASDDAPSIPPRTSSRLAAFFGRRSRHAHRAQDVPPRPGGPDHQDDDDDDDGGLLGTPPWPLPPAAAMLTTPSGETRIRIQTRSRDSTEGGPCRLPPTALAGLGPGGGTTMASMPGGVEEASLTDETATDSLGARLHRAGSQAAIRRLGLPRG